MEKVKEKEEKTLIQVTKETRKRLGRQKGDQSLGSYVKELLDKIEEFESNTLKINHDETVPGQFNHMLSELERFVVNMAILPVYAINVEKGQDLTETILLTLDEKQKLIDGSIHNGIDKLRQVAFTGIATTDNQVNETLKDSI